MHVSDKSKILLEFGSLADCGPPFLNQFQDLLLDSRVSDRRSFWKSADQFIKELLGADLEVERITAVLDAVIQ